MPQLRGNEPLQFACRDFNVALLGINKLVTPQGNMFPTDLELIIFGFVD
jgi:hypothetical protein